MKKLYYISRKGKTLNYLLLEKLNIINNFSDSVYYINNFINFDLVWNTGIGFGLFSYGSSLIYNIITFIATYLHYSLLCSISADVEYNSALSTVSL